MHSDTLWKARCEAPLMIAHDRRVLDWRSFLRGPIPLPVMNLRVRDARDQLHTGHQGIRTNRGRSSHDHHTFSNKYNSACRVLASHGESYSHYSTQPDTSTPLYHGVQMEHASGSCLRPNLYRRHWSTASIHQTRLPKDLRTITTHPATQPTR
jgi:hypothetical protein